MIRAPGISPLYDVKKTAPLLEAESVLFDHGCESGCTRLVEPDGIEPTTSSLQS